MSEAIQSRRDIPIRTEYVADPYTLPLEDLDRPRI